jgi:hypothetical protein
MIDLTVEFAQIGYHSGEAGGIIPETFRIIRMLLDRLDDPKTGQVAEFMRADLPEFKKKEAEFLVEKYGTKLYDKYDIVEGGKYMN